jgi:hypothetical protein
VSAAAFLRLAKGAAWAALFVCATCAAQPNAPVKPDAKAAKSDLPVALPEVKVDDRWVYRRTDRRMKPPTQIYEIRVTFVDSRAIVAVVEGQGGKGQLDATWMRDWQAAVSPDGGVVETERSLLQFPLAPGRQYPAAWEIRRPNIGNFHVRHERRVTVVGWEDIEVAAGKFRALKIQADGYFKRLDRAVQDEARNTFWYVPQVKRWVKSVYQDVQLEVVEELYFYRVQ